MAGTVPAIPPRSITQIIGLPARPVFFVHLNNSVNPSLVIKGEPKAGAGILSDADREISVAWSSKIMKNVNNDQVNTKILDQTETRRFKAFAEATYPANTKQGKFVRDALLWVKMPFVQGLTDAELFDEKVNDFKGSKVKDALKQFLQPTVWRDLGKIVAVDVFNGNNDRFALQSMGPNTPVTVSWGNQGNMMFLTGANAATTMIGLDTWDPSGAGDGRSNLSAGQGDTSFLEVLRTDESRKKFAEQCTDAIGAELSKRMATSSVAIQINGPAGSTILRIKKEDVSNTLRPFSTNFRQGLDSGIADLKVYLNAKAAKYAAQAGGPGAKQIPPGIIARKAYLGW